MTLRARANLMLLLGSAIWGFAFVAQVLGTQVGAFTFNSTRFLLGAASLLPLIAWQDRRNAQDAAARRQGWVAAFLPGLLCGGFLFAASSLQQVGLADTTAGNAAFVTTLYVVFVPLVGIAFGRRATANVWGGVVLGVAGLYLLTMTGGLARVNPGDLLCLISTLFWTGHILTVGHFARRLDPLRLAVVQFVANGVYAGVAALVVEPRPFQGLPAVAWPILYAGLLSVGVAYTLQVLAQRHALEAHAALIMSMEAVFGALGGALFLGERMTGLGYLGAGLMLAGIIWSQLPRRGQPDVPAIPMPEPPSTALDV